MKMVLMIIPLKDPCSFPLLAVLIVSLIISGVVLSVSQNFLVTLSFHDNCVVGFHLRIRFTLADYHDLERSLGDYKPLTL